MQRVYLIHKPEGESKIGISANPSKRRNQLELASGQPLTLVKCWKTLEDTPYSVEQGLHRTFSRRRMLGEWFTHISVADIEYAGWELEECNHDGSDKRDG